MELEGDRRPVLPRESGVGREVRGRDDLGIRRLDDDLVLVRGRDQDALGSIQPGLAANDRIIVESGAPALVRLHDKPAERLGHDLVTKADANHLAVPCGANEIGQRLYPGEAVIDSGGRAGDQDGIVRCRLGKPSRLDVELLDLKAVTQQPFEHRRIVAEPVGEVARRAAGLKDSELHGVRLATSLPFGQWRSERGEPWLRTTGSRAGMPWSPAEARVSAPRPQRTSTPPEPR